MNSRINKKEGMIILVILTVIAGVFFFMVDSAQVTVFDNRLEHDNLDTRAYIGVVLKAEDSEHWRQIRLGAEAAGEALGARVTVMAPDKESNVAQQRQMIKDLVDAGIDALCIAPADSSGMGDLFTMISDRGGKVITIDTNTSDMTNVVTFVGSDNYHAGQLAAERMIQQLNGEGLVLVMTGILSQQTHSDRLQGFREGIRGTDVEVLEVVAANSDFQIAYDRMQAFIRGGNEIDGCFITNGLMTLGALEAIHEDENFPLPLIIGVDVQRELLLLVDEGLVDSFVSQSPYEMGYMAVENALKATAEEEIGKYIQTETVLITEEGLRAYLENYEQ